MQPLKNEPLKMAKILANTIVREPFLAGNVSYRIFLGENLVTESFWREMLVTEFFYATVEQLFRSLSELGSPKSTEFSTAP